MQHQRRPITQKHVCLPIQPQLLDDIGHMLWDFNSFVLRHVFRGPSKTLLQKGLWLCHVPGMLGAFPHTMCKSCKSTTTPRALWTVPATLPLRTGECGLRLYAIQMNRTPIPCRSDKKVSHAVCLQSSCASCDKIPAGCASGHSREPAVSCFRYNKCFEQSHLDGP